MSYYLRKLQQKIETGSNYEVEDILNLAKSPSIASSEYLKDISKKLNWLHREEARIVQKVPFADWADVVIQYIENGADSLVYIAKSGDDYTDNAYFVLALLQYIRTTKNVFSVMKIFDSLINSPSDNIELADKIASALNLLLVFGKDVRILEDTEYRIRSFLHKMLDCSPNDPIRASIFCALRAVGNAESIKRIKASNKLDEPWKGIDSLAIKAIQKRLKR